jgi:hypothetical protein
MAKVGAVQGASKGFDATPKAKANEVYDNKLAGVPKKSLGALKEAPKPQRGEGGATATPRAAQARGSARTPTAPPRQTVEAGGNKGGRVDRRA